MAGWEQSLMNDALQQNGGALPPASATPDGQTPPTPSLSLAKAGNAAMAAAAAAATSAAETGKQSKPVPAAAEQATPNSGHSATVPEQLRGGSPTRGSPAVGGISGVFCFGFDIKIGFQTTVRLI